MTSRTLPTRRNPQLANPPPHSILVEKRCLGQTELKVKPGQVGTTNATKPANLGKLDYAHLRVPLPADLSKSVIFQRNRERKYPDAYFLMRRSSDGFVSATGMFKAGFPFASLDEENAEKEYIKTLAEASTEEIAGNLWVHPDQAMRLADEYGITPWIAALLDPENITQGAKEKDIASPPPYKSEDMRNGTSKSPSDKKKSTRGRNTRAESPSTEKSKARKIATPRKRKARSGKTDDDMASVAATESVNGADDGPAEAVKVVIEKIEEDDGTTETKLTIEMPADSDKLELPNDAAAMLEKAKEMVAQAEAISGSSTSTKSTKRKADEIDDLDTLPVKKTKIEVEEKKRSIRRRAGWGIAGTIAIGAAPIILSLLPWS